MKRIRLNEESYNKLRETLANEMSCEATNDSSIWSSGLPYDVRTSFEDFYNTLNDAIFESKYGDNTNDMLDYLERIKELCEPIYEILHP